MPKVEIYSSPLCGYCYMAKKLLKQKNVDFDEINVLGNAGNRTEMTRRSRHTSVPQIFINDEHIGGFDDIYALDKSGRLDPLLSGISQRTDNSG